ncbi:MAG: LCP family protein [Candidatus Limnocylindrales bacterium]
MTSTLRPILDALDGNQALSRGTDGRLTFLLLGSDARGSTVSRTDSIMLMSIKGNTITSASVPRDTGRVPRPASMGGGTFSGKVNGILRQLVSSTGSLNGGLAAFERVIESVAQIEIDYHALIWFDGFTTLVGKIDPITVNITREIADPKHIDDPNGPAGVYFPKWNGFALNAYNSTSQFYCDGAWRTDPAPINSANYCRRALPYVRSRKGPDNDDWVRSRRQQEFIASTIKAVGQGELSGLVSTAQAEGMGKWWTNYPITSTSAMDLYNQFQGASLGTHVVWKPSVFAARIPGTSAYELKLTAVRQWSAQYLK